MKLLLERIYKRNTYSIGHLYYFDGDKKIYVCDTIEDKDRGLKDSMSVAEINKIKVFGKTAIPSGTYEITLNIKSPRFGSKQFYANLCGGKLPRLLNVKGFEGVLIHCGNTEEDTNGCIIVGFNKVKGKVVDSKTAFTKLYPILKKAKDKITIEIKPKY